MRSLCILFMLAVILLFANQVMAVESTADRPKIGLALSGGGARGGAHIGVLKALEELEVPIDYIAGTSMGAIIGGFYAAGYSPDEIETIIKETNWSEAFSDSPNRREVSMRKKELDSRFLIPHRLGFNKGKVQLPLGVIEGQQIDQIFQRALLRVSDINHFDDLRVPFRAVATDLVTGGEVVLSDGSLPDALRASMSIPSVFAPVLIDDKILVDGAVPGDLPIAAMTDFAHVVNMDVARRLNLFPPVAILQVAETVN